MRPTGTSSITLGASGASRSTSPFSITWSCGTPSLLGEALMGVQVAGLAVDRDGDLRPDPAVHLLHLVAARVARHVDEVIVLGDDLDALADQLVVQVVERALVAGDDLGAEDHGVAGLEPDPRVLADGDPDKALPRLALAAGAQIEHLVARQQRRPRARRGSAACSAGSRPRAPPRASGASSGRPRTARGRRRCAASIAVSSRATLEAKVVSDDAVGLCARSARSGSRAPRPRSPTCRATARWCCRT